MTHDTDNTCLARAVLRCPRKVTRIKTKRTVLKVSAPDADGVDPFCTQTGLRSLATELKLALFAVVCTLGTTCRALMP